MLETEDIEIFRAQTLAASSTTTFSREFQLGEGWTRLHLQLNIALTHGNGSGAIAEGELNIIKNILLKTDKGEILANCPGRVLYRFSQIKSGTAPVKTAIAATTGTYIVPITIWFADKRLSSQECNRTILDTSRYGSLTLQVTMGSSADLLGTVGTDTIALTMDASIERFKGVLPANLKPRTHVQYGVQPAANPASTTSIDLERAANLAYKRLLLLTTSGAVAGVPADGVMDSTVITDFDVEKTGGYLRQNMLADMNRRQTQVDYDLEAITAGMHLVSFVDKSKSLATSYRSGGDSRLKFNWRNTGSLPSGAQVTAAYEGIRPLSSDSLR